MHNQMELVHMNPGEIHELNQLQGGQKKAPDGAWDLSGTQAVFNHPKMRELFDDHMYQHNMRKLASGGHIEQMQEHGRHGDSEMAWLPSNVARIFDHHNGQTSHNPKTGKKEYFLGALAGLARVAMPFIGGAARAAAPALSTAGRTAARVVPSLGTNLVNTARTAGTTLANAGRSVRSAGKAVAANPYVKAIGSGVKDVANLGWKTAKGVGNVANIALPVGMAYDYFSAKAKGEQPQNPDGYTPNGSTYNPAANPDYGNRGNSGSGGYSYNNYADQPYGNDDYYNRPEYGSAPTGQSATRGYVSNQGQEDSQEMQNGDNNGSGLGAMNPYNNGSYNGNRRFSSPYDNEDQMDYDNGHYKSGIPHRSLGHISEQDQGSFNSNGTGLSSIGGMGGAPSNNMGNNYNSRQVSGGGGFGSYNMPRVNQEPTPVPTPMPQHRHDHHGSRDRGNYAQPAAPYQPASPPLDQNNQYHIPDFPTNPYGYTPNVPYTPPMNNGYNQAATQQRESNQRPTVEKNLLNPMFNSFGGW